MWLSCRFMVCCRPPRRSTLFPYTTLFRSQRTGFADTDDTVALCRERLRLPCPYAVCNRGRVELGRYGDRKSTRLNSSHVAMSYAVFCLKKKTYRGGGDDTDKEQHVHDGDD